jgi:putative colanic acid biosynthesis acetyltransferase WcaF
LAEADFSIQDLSQFCLPPGFRGRSALVVLTWQIVQATVFRFSPRPMYAWRRLLLRMFGAKIGTGMKIRPTARVEFPWRLEIGEYAWIGDDAYLYSLAPISVGAQSVISQRSYLCAAQHDYRRVDFAMVARPISVGSQVWLATDVFVAPGVTIGNGSVIGARSSVFCDIPANVIAYGTPARVQGLRIPSEPTTGH